MDRLISEQAVIDRLTRWYSDMLETGKEQEDLIEVIKAIPSAEPSGDLISRQDAIKAIDEKAKRIKNEDTLNGLAGAVGILFDLPPVKPQEKTGHWITWREAGNVIPSETRFECSVCHDAAQTLCNGLDLLSSYCPNCGAKMAESEKRE